MNSNWIEAMPSATSYLVSKVLYRLHHRPDDFAAFTADRMRYLEAFPLVRSCASLCATTTLRCCIGQERIRICCERIASASTLQRKYP
jgi:hypothetical protein